MKVVVISGKAQHGKDTTANLLKQSLEADGKSVLITHYADLLKYICKQFFGWNGEKDKHGRQLLQHVGTDVIRASMPDFWVDFVASVLRLFPNHWDYVLIPDCRFPNEIEVLKKADFDVIHIRVERPGFQSPLTQEQQGHSSETALDGVKPDYHLYNFGNLGDLCAEVAKLRKQVDL